MKKSCRTCKYYHLNEDCMPCYVCTDGNQFELDNEFAQVEWIRVEDRLPQEDTRVLVYLRLDKINTKVSFDTDRISKGEWVRWGDRVTHWQPLPTPPKMKGAE